MSPPASPLPHAHPSPPRASRPPSAPAESHAGMSSSPRPSPYSPIFVSQPSGHGTPPSIFNRPITPPPRPPTPPLATPAGQIWWYGCGHTQPKDLAIPESGWADTEGSTKRKDSKGGDLERAEQRRRLYNESLEMSPTIVAFVPGYLERYLEPEDARRVLARVNYGVWDGRHLGVVQEERKIRQEILERIVRREDGGLTLQDEEPKDLEETGKLHEDKPVKRILWRVIEGSNTAGNFAIAKKEDDELRKNNYSKWWLKHDDATLEKKKQEAEEEERKRLEMEEQEKQEDDDADFWNYEDDEEEEEESYQTYLAGVRMEQIKSVNETDRIGRRYDLDGDLIPEPEPNFWTTGEVKDVPPQTEEERRIRLDRSQRTRDRREKERRDREAAKDLVEEDDVEMTIDEGGEPDTEGDDADQDDEDVEIHVEEKEPNARDSDIWLRRSR